MMGLMKMQQMYFADKFTELMLNNLNKAKDACMMIFGQMTSHVLEVKIIFQHVAMLKWAYIIATQLGNVLAFFVKVKDHNIQVLFYFIVMKVYQQLCETERLKIFVMMDLIPILLKQLVKNYMAFLIQVSKQTRSVIQTISGLIMLNAQVMNPDQQTAHIILGETIIAKIRNVYD